MFPRNMSLYTMYPSLYRTSAVLSNLLFVKLNSNVYIFLFPPVET